MFITGTAQVGPGLLPALPGLSRLSLSAFAGLSWCLIALGLSRPIVASPGLAWPLAASRGLSWHRLASPVCGLLAFPNPSPPLQASPGFSLAQGLDWPPVASPGPKMAPTWPKIAP